MSLHRAVETAIKMETDAMKFYRDAVKKTSHPLGKRLFEGFVTDEVRHLKMLQQIMDNLDIEITKIDPKESIKTIFTELKDQMMSRITAPKMSRNQAVPAGPMSSNSDTESAEPIWMLNIAITARLQAGTRFTVGPDGLV